MAAAPVGMKRFYTVLGLVAVAGIGILGYLMARPNTVSIPADVVVQPSDTAGFHGYFLGSETAPIVVTEYADYQCPACQDFEVVQFPAVREQLIATGRVRWRYRDFPLSMHQFARVAAHAAACADEQDRFWDMHRMIYQGQREWSMRGAAAPVFHSYAQALSFDLERYEGCMQSGRYAGRIQASFDEGVRAGVNSTPTFLIGDRLYPGVMSSDELKRIADSLAPAAP